MTSRLKQAGFTIVELTIATAVFSVILVVITTGIISFTKSYLKGVHQSQTQETARSIMGEIDQSLQFSAGFSSNTTDPTLQAYCFGNVKYTLRLNPAQPFSSSDPDPAHHGIIRSPLGAGVACAPETSFAAGDTELLGDGMRLQSTSLAPVIQDLGNNTYTISFNIIYGDEDLSPNDRCLGGAGSEYCAAASLTSTVQRRLAN